jgi:sugar lactone lactonase YvrE
VADEEGNVFVADLFNHRVRKITASGVVTTVAGSSYGFADGSGAAAKFAYPAGLALDKQGNLYVADTENNRIRKITPAGVVTTFAGLGSKGTVDGAAAVAQFYSPREIDIDANGNIYIVEAGNHRIRKVD